MRRLLLVLVAGWVLGNTSCLLTRSAESEDLPEIELWGRIWFTDEPAQPIPERVHGGIQ